MTPRVLMVTGAYYPEISSGGLQCQMMARLLAARAEVHVLTTAVDRTLPHRSVVDGVPVCRIVVDVRSAISKIRAMGRMLAELLRLMPRSDVVHIHGCSAKNVLVALVARLLRRRLVLSLHTAAYDEPEAIRRQGALAWWAFRSGDVCMCVSPALVDAYLAAGLPPHRILHVPNGVDTDRFRPATAAERLDLRRRIGLPERQPIILFVGFFSHDKQPRVLFDAWLKMQTKGVDTTLVYVGATRSPYFEVDEDLAAGMKRDADARALGNRVVFAGATHDIQDYFRAADVFVLPSRREGLPVALLEAMSCGLPCIASRLPGSTDGIITDGENGVLIEPGHAEGIVEAIARLLGDRARANALGAAARATVTSRFDGARTADRWLDVYRDVLQEMRP